jgi:GntR family galactonate operon transcriptional repressor
MDRLKREGLHEQITRKLGLAILSGELRDGEVSSELALCKSLGVSRTVLRESIKVLASKGLLGVRPKVGVRILPRREWNLFDPDVLTWQAEAVVAVDEDFVRTLCEVRLIVETAAAGLAAARATPEERASIARCFQKMEMCLDDKPAHDEADIAFHGAIFDASHNDLLRQLGKTIRAALRRQDRTGSGNELGKMMELHRNACQAICRGEVRSATIAMESVILHGARAIFRSPEDEIASGRAGCNDPQTSETSRLRSAPNLPGQVQDAFDRYEDGNALSIDTVAPPDDIPVPRL